MPLAAIVSLSVISSSQVVGTVQPFSLNIFGEYQTKRLHVRAQRGAVELAVDGGVLQPVGRVVLRRPCVLVVGAERP